MVSRDREEQEKEVRDRGRPEDVSSLEVRKFMGFERSDTEENGNIPGRQGLGVVSEALGFLIWLNGNLEAIDSPWHSCAQSISR